MSGLKPFFCYYGGKWRAAPKYPAPKYNAIIEPFAGAAGYATRYYQHDVLLADADPVIAALWQYLIKVKRSEILSLPVSVDHVDDLCVVPEAKSLVGFWLNKGAASPRRQPSKWMRGGIHPNGFWGESIRARIADQVERIRHWRAVHSSYTYIPDQAATWFVDPPYQVAGKHYRYHDIDYRDLASWCLTRTGQTIVCEAAGAAWLPFEPFGTIRANGSRTGKRFSHEVLYLQYLASTTDLAESPVTP